MIGAGAIASGAQGCIFSPKLEQQGNYAVSGANTKSASKVFANQNMFLSEQQMLGRIAPVSNEGLLTILGNDFTAPRGLGPANRQSARAYDSDPNSACGQAANPNPVHVLQMPRVDGDIERLRPDSMPLKFFLKAYNALMRLRNAEVVHGDMGRRNIFYKGDSALIGDFGSSMFLGIPDPDTNGLNTFINRFISPNSTSTFEERLKLGFNQLDSISIEAFYALCIYALWPNKQEYILAILDKGPIKTLIDNYEFDFPVLEKKLFLSHFMRSGILTTRTRGRWTDGIMSIANKAATTSTREEFWITVKKVLLNSDIKQFILASIKFINMSDEKKENLLSEIVYNSNFSYFYRLGKFPIPNDIIAMFPREQLTIEELLRLPRDQLRPHNLLRLPRASLSRNEFLRLPHAHLTPKELMSLPHDTLTPHDLVRLPRNTLSPEELMRLPRNKLNSYNHEFLRLSREELTNEEFMKLPHDILSPKELLRIPPEHRTLQNRVRILKHTGGKKRRVTRRRKN